MRKIIFLSRKKYKKICVPTLPKFLIPLPETLISLFGLREPVPLLCYVLTTDPVFNVIKTVR